MYNVLIRPLQKEDALISYQWRNDPEVWKYTGSRPDIEITKEIESEWIVKVLQDEKSKRFAILCDNEYIGNVHLNNIENNAAEFHIFIGNKDFWGKGISQLATYQILYYAKEVLKLSEIYLYVKPENIAAVESYKRNNFVVIEENPGNVKMLLRLSELKNTTVSIFVMVYNHGQYLKDCLDSLLEQKTNFNYDIVVGEDCSKDNSREILLSYQKLYPGKFKLLLHPNNIGAAENQRIVLENSQGKYVAICEGDDYWTNPLKLQKQVDFLESNIDYVLCFHKVKILKPTGEVVDDFITKIPENYELRRTLAENSNYIHTPSVVFRNISLTEYQSLEFRNSPIGDYFLYLALANHGKMGYLDETMCVYRYGVGIFSSLDNFKQLKANISLYVNLYSNEKDPIIKTIFYRNFQNAMSQVEYQYIINDKLLKTRRHKIVEKIYKRFKK
ncbi:Protein N-acetyltransferase, RimJ/RimL family [Chryseobacterium oranimense]|uniref:Protein N-acetyltransferase, RimJ/RimL family n=1 Tax=Chryseobacterium oranimense TaxID=421058 RepID=A0A1M5P6N9_9FLAO|nr:GNAT family N-acetyltransferase [Chryseobacterium oranimense]SHG97375.1 Protein N-acetyltransferase, RimJ/RimL family [Chryseobacterium oranimense]